MLVVNVLVALVNKVQDRLFARPAASGERNNVADAFVFGGNDADQGSVFKGFCLGRNHVEQASKKESGKGLGTNTLLQEAQVR